MKKYALILSLLILSIANTKAQDGAWNSIIEGPDDYGDVASLAIINNNILMGTYTGLYISPVSGGDWQHILSPTSGSTTLWINSIAGKDNYLYAGTYGNEVNSALYVSTDNGNSWDQTFKGDTVISLVIKEANPNIIFAGTMSNGVYFSTDNGSHWVQSALDSGWIWSLAVKGNNIIAGPDNGGIYVSTNDGITWEKTYNSNSPIYSFATDGTNIYATIFGEGVFISQDDGITWEKFNSPDLNVRSLAISGSKIFVGTYNGVFLSTNNGVSWELVGFSTYPIYLLVANDDYIFALPGEQGAFRAKISDLTSDVNEDGFDLENNFIYPNPATDYVNVKNYIGWQYEMHDLLGHNIKSGFVNSENINVAKISSGFYTLIFSKEGQQVIQKFIKN